MPLPDLQSLQKVAGRLERLGLPYAFAGGSIVNLLLDYPDLSPARATDDVDVIVEIVTTRRYSEVEAELRALKFDHDMSPKAPRCRWILEGITVDIMPVEGGPLGLNTVWFAEALASALERTFGAVKLRLISPPAFLATKIAAFDDRGGNDCYGSHDLEDLLTVIDGRRDIVNEVKCAPEGVAVYIADFFREMLDKPVFLEALSGHLPADAANQARLPGLRQKLRTLAGREG